MPYGLNFLLSFFSLGGGGGRGGSEGHAMFFQVTNYSLGDFHNFLQHNTQNLFSVCKKQKFLHGLGFFKDTG